MAWNEKGMREVGTSMSVMPTGERSKEVEFNEVVQIDHPKTCMTDSGYNQVLVMIDHFTKYAEAVSCITASAEETCDHVINTWIAIHGCPMTIQSDVGTAFVEKLTKELMRRSQVAQAHSTTYRPQTNG